MDYSDHITFWPVTLKLIGTYLHQILPECSSTWATPYLLWILKSIQKSKFYGHFKRISPKNSSIYVVFYSICLKLTEIMNHNRPTETIYMKYHLILSIIF